MTEEIQNIHKTYKESKIKKIAEDILQNLEVKNFCLDNEKQTRRLVELDEDYLKKTVSSVKELVMKLLSKHTTVQRYLQQVEKTPKLRSGYFMNCLKPTKISKLTSVLLFILVNSPLQFLNRLVIGDKKMNFFLSNIKRRRHWFCNAKKAQSQPNGERYLKRLDYKGTN